MSWITISTGHLLQCDRCGYLRGSYFKRDGVGRRYADRYTNRTPFKATDRLPSSWRTWPEGGPDAHLCPNCSAVREPGG